MAAGTAAWSLCGPCAPPSAAALLKANGRQTAEGTVLHRAGPSSPSISGYVAPNQSKGLTSRWISLPPSGAKQLSEVHRPSPSRTRTLIVRVSDAASSITSTSPSSSSSPSSSGYPSPTAFVGPDGNLLPRQGAAPLFKDVVEVDHYTRLGCSRKALLEEKSFDILSTDEKRRIYDWGLLILSRPDNVYTWPCEADITQTSPSSNKPQKTTFDEDDSEEINKVAYFFWGWFAISLILGFLLQ